MDNSLVISKPRSKLPTSIWGEILSFIPFINRTRIRTVCKLFRIAIDQDSSYRTVVNVIYKAVWVYEDIDQLCRVMTAVQDMNLFLRAIELHPEVTYYIIFGVCRYHFRQAISHVLNSPELKKSLRKKTWHYLVASQNVDDWIWAVRAKWISEPFVIWCLDDFGARQKILAEWTTVNQGSNDHTYWEELVDQQGHIPTYLATRVVEHVLATQSKLSHNEIPFFRSMQVENIITLWFKYKRMFPAHGDVYTFIEILYIANRLDAIEAIIEKDYDIPNEIICGGRQLSTRSRMLILQNLASRIPSMAQNELMHLVTRLVATIDDWSRCVLKHIQFTRWRVWLGTYSDEYWTYEYALKAFEHLTFSELIDYAKSYPALLPRLDAIRVAQNREYMYYLRNQSPVIISVSDSEV